MTDRELLELAAKAAGVKRTIDWLGHHEYMPEWNPLEDDGDALRLAVKLQMLVSIGHFVDAQTHHDDDHKCSGYTTEVAGADPYAATRRAIVRAAAEVGRTK